MTAPLGPIAQKCQDLVNDLKAAGVRASLSRGSLEVPGAWVRPDAMTGRATLAGWAPDKVRVSVILVAPQAGDLEALTDLEALLAATLTVIDPDEDVDTTVVLPHRNNPLPAFRVVVDLDL
jgi:hypothetical protein